MNELLKVMAEHIRVRRRALGLTQEQLAEKAGLSTNYIARLELASNTPSMTTLIRLSNALGVEVSELLAFGEVTYTKRDQAEEIAYALEHMEDAHANFVLDQIRSLADFVQSVEDK